ncbi:TPA: MFS transporter [Klebsiella michiganensis]|nr:MFS transporter [Klebsiella michiganensis]
MGIASRLKLMSFLQYFIWGSWLVTLGSYMINTLHFTGANVGIVYSSKGLAAIIMPAIMGIVADKWLRAERAYMLCHLVCAGVLLYATTVTDPETMFWVMLINAMAYMPTISLSNSISYSCLAQSGQDPATAFPPVRVFGTLGFIVAMWTVSLMGLELSSAQLYIASAASLLLAIYALTLPKIAVTEKKPGATLATRLGLDAFVLFKNPRMAIFFFFAMMLGAVLQITNVFGNPFLHDFARNPAFADSFVVRYPSILLSVSQMAEVAFILTIPFFLKRFGFFAFGDPSPFGFVLLLMSMIVYGCAFDFFNISGSVFVEQEAGAHIRASAQGLFMTMVNGVGAWVGSVLSGMAVDYFSVDGVKEWQTIWLVFAAYSLLLAVIFAAFFKYKHEPEKLMKKALTH